MNFARDSLQYSSLTEISASIFRNNFARSCDLHGVNPRSDFCHFEWNILNKFPYFWRDAHVDSHFDFRNFEVHVWFPHESSNGLVCETGGNRVYELSKRFQNELSTGSFNKIIENQIWKIRLEATKKRKLANTPISVFTGKKSSAIGERFLYRKREL